MPPGLSRVGRRARPAAYCRCPKKGHTAVKIQDADRAAEDPILGEIGEIERTERVRVTGDNDQAQSDLSVRIADLSQQLAVMDDDDSDLIAEISAIKRQRKALRSTNPRWEVRWLGETYLPTGLGENRAGPT